MKNKKQFMLLFLGALVLTNTGAFAQGRMLEPAVKSTSEIISRTLASKGEVQIAGLIGPAVDAATLSGVSTGIKIFTPSVSMGSGPLVNSALISDVNAMGGASMVPSAATTGGNTSVIVPRTNVTELTTQKVDNFVPVPQNNSISPTNATTPYTGTTNEITTAANLVQQNQLALTDVERSILPVNGKVQSEVRYNAGGLGNAQIRVVNQSKKLEVFVGGSDEYKAIQLSPELVEFAPYFFQLDNHAALDAASFPDLWQKNKEILEASLENSMKLTKAVANNQRFYHSLTSEVTGKMNPYYNYLPAEAVDYIYVGEVHYNPLMHEELTNLVLEVKRRYPGHNVYLATEYVWDTLDWTELGVPSSPAIATNKEQLREILGEKKYTNIDFKFLHDAIDVGVTVVGIEPRIATINYVDFHVPSSRGLSQRVREFATSAYGLQWRNEKWIEHLLQIRAMDPKAVIVVYGGAQHISLHELTSVPSLMKEKGLEGSSFSIALMDERGRESFNPVLATLEDQQFLFRQFEEDFASKYILSFKKSNLPDGVSPQELDKFQRALGAETVVYLKDLSPMIIP